MMAADIDRLRLRVRDIVRGRAKVLLVYLFGSQAGGEVGPLSDIDLAVLLTPGAPVPKVRSQLAHAFSIALEGERVDLIILDRVPIELAYSIIAQGQVLYQRDLAVRVEYEADVLGRYGDYLAFVRAQQQ